MEERVSDIEGWRISTVQGLNSKVLPAVARLQRQISGIQKRIDVQSRYNGYNRYVYDNEGKLQNVNWECLDVAQQVKKVIVEKKGGAKHKPHEKDSQERIEGNIAQNKENKQEPDQKRSKLSPKSPTYNQDPRSYSQFFPYFGPMSHTGCSEMGYYDPSGFGSSC